MPPSAQRMFPLSQISASDTDARQYSLARRNLLPREELLSAVSGLWAHEFLVGTGARIETFLWCPGPACDDDRRPSDDPQVSDRMQACAEAVVGRAQASYVISARTLRRLHPGLSAPAMLSVVRLPKWDCRVLCSTARLLLVADGIEYAGNLGTLIRTVDACGADALLLTSPVARLTNPKVFVASRGTVLTTPVLEYPSVVAARQALLAAGFAVHVADPSAVHRYREISYDSARLAFVVGSEGDGAAPGWRDRGLNRVAIPMLGRADSLNVAASAAILLFEARAHRGTLPRP